MQNGYEPTQPGHINDIHWKNHKFLFSLVLLSDMPIYNYDFVQRMTWEKLKTLGPGEFNYSECDVFQNAKTIIDFHYS